MIIWETNPLKVAVQSFLSSLPFVEAFLIKHSFVMLKQSKINRKPCSKRFQVLDASLSFPEKNSWITLPAFMHLSHNCAGNFHGVLFGVTLPEMGMSRTFSFQNSL